MIVTTQTANHLLKIVTESETPIMVTSDTGMMTVQGGKEGGRMIARSGDQGRGALSPLRRDGMIIGVVVIAIGPTGISVIETETRELGMVGIVDERKETERDGRAVGDGLEVGVRRGTGRGRGTRGDECTNVARCVRGSFFRCM
ncbi:hypothetical protein DACRYDRAFT_108495 [Dacryopinax primogenitus]|uniref:Uncharacterized protein n=1 Tax=Dacryopinax primogenitus (strain DJM 731) TaxID=1858805 RepID=M5FXG5_DACPD|nr:uncharacterized protein DACRYDRAFT_108495 [Dacryopinax primogenitus]EJU01164.1 hypothetical protein DACRYDRAFT_108495 [Dacryopinax primogenitus]